MAEAQDVELLARKLLANPFDLSLPVAPDLRAAFQEDRQRSGISPVHRLVSEHAAAESLEWSTLGERRTETKVARGFLLRVNPKARESGTYTHVIVLDREQQIVYASVRGLSQMSETSSYVRSLVHWDIGSAISALLRHYGFSGNYNSGQETKFEVNPQQWERWTVAQRNDAIERARMLASDYRSITFGIAHSTRLQIVSMGDQIVFYSGVA